MPPDSRGAGARRRGEHTLLERLGEGAAAEVWLAHGPSGERVAVKVPKRREATLFARLEREAAVSTRLDHPALPTIAGIFRDGEGPYIVMELLTGRTLARELAERGPMTVAEALALARALSSGLAHAHERGVIHRDVKVENVFLDAAKGPKLLDFGLAKVSSSDEAPGSAAITEAGQVLGTPYAMAPELAFGEDFDHRADLWSLGVVLFHVLTGRRPVDGDGLRQVMRVLLVGAVPSLAVLRPDLPPPLTGLVDGLLSRAPRDRPQSAAQVLEVLEGLEAVTR